MANTYSRLSKLNGFEKTQHGVYQAPGEQADFNYSDGKGAERALLDILENTQDLSSSSSELQAQICDWPSEYHLSVTRANLLRALNLSGVKRVLELGCGCGSITRYLGEQEGIEVDAVEGSASRAALARMRCRDQGNVEICTANFNDIQLPQAEYDLVLFVGVTEYAGRFSDAVSDQEALSRLLLMGKRACKTDGVVLVAIENRLGMKYALGACEDHYAIPYVGIDDYPQSTGIRTYSKTEWLAQIKRAGFDHHNLLLPFPDYKIPTTMIREDCDSGALKQALCSVRSRDYTQAFVVGNHLSDNEQWLWQTLAQAGTLADHSNSFLWLLGDAPERIQSLADQSFVEFTQPSISYQLPQPADTQMREQDAKLIEHLNAQITQLESHSSNLEGKVEIMSNSIGWKFLNGVRRMFRKTTL